jgi:hypothetical protein
MVPSLRLPKAPKRTITTRKLNPLRLAPGVYVGLVPGTLIVARRSPAEAIVSYRVGEDRGPHRRPATKTIPPGCGGFRGPRPFGSSLQAANAQQLSRGILHAWTQRTPSVLGQRHRSRSLRRATSIGWATPANTLPRRTFQPLLNTQTVGWQPYLRRDG